MNDFIKAIEAAQSLPDIGDQEQGIPDIFSGFDSTASQLFSKGTSGDEGVIPGALKTNFEYHCARLTVGKELECLENGMPVYKDVDESDALKEIMDNVLAGKFLLLKKQETFLKDGTVVIWVEWSVTKSEPSKEERGFLTTEELLSPELPSSKD